MRSRKQNLYFRSLFPIVPESSWLANKCGISLDKLAECVNILNLRLRSNLRRGLVAIVNRHIRKNYYKNGNQKRQQAEKICLKGLMPL